MADRVFIFHESDDRFRAFDFSGTVQVTDNWLPGFGTIDGAAANYTHIYALDTSGSTAVARAWSYAVGETNITETRQLTLDITMSSTDTYIGIALTPTHLVAINRTDGKLEYYQLSDRTYDSDLDVTLPTIAADAGQYAGICRSGNFLYLITEDSTFPHNPRIYKRNLDGSAVSDWAGQLNSAAGTIFATYDRVVAIRRFGGHWDRWDFDGDQDTTIASVGQGGWTAAYTLFDLATVAFSNPVKNASGQFLFSMTWTDGHGGFAQNDLSLNHGTITGFTPTGATGQWQITVTPPSSGSGTIILTVREDAVTEKNKETTLTVGTFEGLDPTTSVRVSGNGQTAEISTALANPLVVEVRDQNGDPLGGVTVNWSVSPTDGTLSATSSTTGSNGRAQTNLTLGSTAGTYTVTASVAGIATDLTFTATATAPPPVATTLSRVSGNAQSAEVGNALANPFVVSVVDQNGAPFQGATVNFAITAGSGATLSAASDTTDANGQAETTLTLGATAGTYTVRATVSGINGNVQFTATATAPIPATLNLSFPVSVLDHGETRTLTITSDKNITLEAEDITQTGGATLESFAGSDDSFTIDVTAPTTGSGNIVINIAENAVPEMNDAVSLTIPYREIQAPTLSSTLTELIDGATTDVLITFPNTVSGFGEANVDVDEGTLSNFTVVTTGRVFRVTVTPPASGKGDITLTIAADVVPERNAAASLTIAYSYPVTFTFSAPRALMGQGETQTVTIDADQGVTEFVESDVTITGGTFENFTKVSNSQYTVDVTAPATGAGNIVLSIAEDVVPEDNAAAKFTIAYRNIIPPPAAPIDVSVDLKPTTALLTWNSGGGAIEAYEVNVSEGAALGPKWIPTGSTRTRYLVKHLKRGTEYTFAVRGVNDAGEGPASSSVTERTPIASLHNALFFKTCVNYLEDGARVSEHGNAANIIRAVSDNDYRTFSTETDYDINIAVNGDPTRVDAVFVKGIGIEGHSAVPIGGSGSGYSNRRVPATVKNWEGTDISTIVNGFQHDLYLLDQPFTATSVRLTFTGTETVKIVEVMLLEFGLEIDANGDFTEINPDFVDRSGEIHSTPGGSLGYGSPVGAERDKWEIDYAVKVVPGKTLLETPEEFLYWRSGNRNHVHAQEPSRFPWRIFPATFVGERVPVRYRTDDKTGGETLTFSVSEQ